MTDRYDKIQALSTEQKALYLSIWRRLERGGSRLRARYTGWRLRLSLARQARAMRKARGWSLTEVGRRAGLHWTTVWRFENGSFRITLNTAIKIAAAFDVGLECRFLPWSETVYRKVVGEDLDLAPRSFDEELPEIEASLDQGGNE